MQPSVTEVVVVYHEMDGQGMSELSQRFAGVDEAFAFVITPREPGQRGGVHQLILRGLDADGNEREAIFEFRSLSA